MSSSFAAVSLSLIILYNGFDSIIALDQKWELRYQESFSTPLNGADWVLDTYEKPFDTIMDDAGKWYENDYGPEWNAALDSFHTYRKEFTIGQDGWLTASLSGRDWDKDGSIEDPPSMYIDNIDGSSWLVMDVPDHTGGAILRPTNPLPSEYRIEYKLKTIDFGGKRNGDIAYDGRINGYNEEGCKTQHPWGEGSKSRGWSGDASVPYCEWQDVREGPYGYNGFHFLSIVDFADPAPRNNHFWHYRRKVVMDSFSQHPDRVGDDSGGTVCNSATNEYYEYRDSNFNTVNMWICGLPNFAPNPGGLAGNQQWFITSCNDGVAARGVSSAAELQPELMPTEYYTFAIERNSTGYTLETSGNFARAGQQTLRFHRPFVVDDVPIWHYNSDASEYDGRFNKDLLQENFAYGSSTWANQWPEGSVYPDFFVIGDLYTNVYEGMASLTDIRMYEVAANTETPSETPAPPPISASPLPLATPMPTISTSATNTVSPTILPSGSPAESTFFPFSPASDVTESIPDTDQPILTPTSSLVTDSPISNLVDETTIQPAAGAAMGSPTSSVSLRPDWSTILLSESPLGKQTPDLPTYSPSDAPSVRVTPESPNASMSHFPASGIGPRNGPFCISLQALWCCRRSWHKSLTEVLSRALSWQVLSANTIYSWWLLQTQHLLSL